MKRLSVPGTPPRSPYRERAGEPCHAKRTVSHRGVPARIPVLFALLLLVSTVAVASADDTGGIILPDFRHIDIRFANGGTNYIKFDGGGQNALHFTTSTSEPYGQVTTTDKTKGMFYLSETGGRGFFDDTILMVCIKGDVPDDFKIKVRASGYRWPQTAELNQPPTMDAVRYVPGSLTGTFTKADFIYGPQNWKPCNRADYPVYFGQDMSDPSETFRFCFIDLKAGLLGPNSYLSGLTDNGMLKLEYEIENSPEFLVFNMYGWCNQSNQGRGISWTNDVAGESDMGVSGFMIRTGSTPPGGDVAPGSGSSGGGMSMEGGSTTTASGEQSLKPSFSGTVNGPVVIAVADGNATPLAIDADVVRTVDLPLPANSTVGQGRLFVYTATGTDRSRNVSADVGLLVSIDGATLPTGQYYRGSGPNGTIGTLTFDLAGRSLSSGPHKVAVRIAKPPEGSATLEGLAIVAATDNGGSPSAFWVLEGCDVLRTGSTGIATLASFTDTATVPPGGSAILSLVSTGDPLGREVRFNGGYWNVTRTEGVAATALNVAPFMLDGTSSAAISVSPVEPGPGTLVNRNAVLVVSSGAAPSANVSVKMVPGNLTHSSVVETVTIVSPATAESASVPTSMETVSVSAPVPAPVDPITGFIDAIFSLFGIFDTPPANATGGNPAGGRSAGAVPTTGVTSAAVYSTDPTAATTVNSADSMPPTGGNSTDSAPSPVTYTITVISSPPGAAVSLDGAPAGTAPATIPSVTPGIHRLGLDLAGYEPIETEFEVAGDEEVTVTMNSAAIGGSTDNSTAGATVRNTRGGVYITSLPSGEKVTVDGKATEFETPFVFAALQEGSHTIRLESFPDGRVWVYPGAISMLEFSSGTQQSRSISITSDSFRGDEFSVNGKFPKYRIPARVSLSGTGAYVTVSDQGRYLVYPVSDFFVTGDSFDLRPQDGTLAGVTVATDPAGADIFIDGFPTGLQTPALVPNVSAGEHRVMVSKLGRLPAEKIFSVVDDPSRDSDTNVSFRLDPYQYGTLAIRSNPPNAKIYLDGIDTRERTPYSFTHLWIGSYALKVSSGTSSKNFDLVMAPGQELSYDIDFTVDKASEKKSKIEGYEG